MFRLCVRMNLFFYSEQGLIKPKITNIFYELKIIDCRIEMLFVLREKITSTYVRWRYTLVRELETTFKQGRLTRDVVVHLDHLDEVCPTASMCNWSMTLWCLSVSSLRWLTYVETLHAALAHVTVFSSSNTNV